MVSVNKYIRTVTELTEWNKAVMARKKKRNGKRKPNKRDGTKQAQGHFK